MNQHKRFSNLVFVDLLFNLLIGFVSLFIIAFLLINPIADQGIIDPKAEMIITLEWDDHSRDDLDLWVRGPTGDVVGFVSKDRGYMVLERDDLGRTNDTFFMDGTYHTIYRNFETVIVSQLVDGEYVINVHYFNKPYNTDPPELIRIEVKLITPYKLIYSGTIDLNLREEKTVVSFLVHDKEIVDINTNIQLPVRIGRGSQ